MKRQAAFSLVELLMIVAIIGLLVGILVPSLGKAKEYAKRAVCTGNLNAIGKTALMYNSEYGVFPSMQNAWTQAAYVGYRGGDTDLDIGGANGKSHSRAWYRLVSRMSLSLKAFKCPSDGQVDTGESGGGGYDFPAGDDVLIPLSYSMQVSLYDPFKPKTSPARGMLVTVSSDRALAIAADNNGLLKWTRQQADNCWRAERDLAVAMPTSTDAAAGINSPNHARQGQNVLYVGGTVAWCKNPLVGVNNDNIYTRYDGSELGVDDGADTGGNTGGIANRPMYGQDDSLLLP